MTKTVNMINRKNNNYDIDYDYDEYGALPKYFTVITNGVPLIIGVIQKI